MSIKSIAIVGAGAVGSYYGARLAESGLDVRFLLKSDYEHVMEHGLSVKSIDGDIELEDVSCALSSEEIGEVDLVIVAWKTTANQHYQSVITPLLHKDTKILTLQNGLGNVEELARLFGADRVYGGLCFVCINRLSPGVIHHTASGMIRIGQYSELAGGLESLVSTLSAGGIRCEVVENLEKAQWMKLVWNIPFNGLTIAHGGIDTEELLNIPGMEQEVFAIMKEVQLIGAGLRHSIADNFLERQIAITWPMEKYRPSSMIDFVEGREVEVNAIWQEPLHHAGSLHITTPKISHLLDQIKQQIARRDGKTKRKGSR